MSPTDATSPPGSRAPGEVTRITSAPEPLSEDVARRSRRYLAQMTVRVVCFLGAVVVDHWSRWLLLVGAVVLPYVAVVLANAGRERSTEPGTASTPAALPAGATAHLLSGADGPGVEDPR